MPSPSVSTDRRSRPAATLLAVCLAALVLPLNFSGGAVATPAIGRALGGAPLALAWINNAFMLSFGSLMLAAGMLADRHGRRRVFLGGLAVFSLASAATAAAGSVAAVDLLRLAQGVGAAAALSAGSAGLAQLYAGAARTRAFGLLGTTFGVGLAFGPWLAGALIERTGWRGIFLALAALAAAAALLAMRAMPESRDETPAPADPAGAVCFSVTLALATAGLIQGPLSGWTAAPTLALLAAATILLAAFVVQQRRRKQPLLDLALLRQKRFLGVQLLPVATCYGYVVLLVLLPLRLIGIEGNSPAQAGLTLFALSAPMLAVPPLAAGLARRVGPGRLSALGLALAAVGLYALGSVPADGQVAVLVLVLVGIGNAVPWGLMDALAVSVVPPARAGMAAGLFGTVRVAGEGIALAVVAALLGALLGMRLTAMLPDQPVAALASAARSLAGGDLAQAARTLPMLEAGTLRRVYADGFRALCHSLAAITLLSAAGVECLLGRGSRDGDG